MKNYKNPNRFSILTLSDNNRYQIKSRLGDPISIITAGASVLNSLFPNIFGGNRKELTNSMWLELIPGSGYYTTALRNYLKTRIKYDVDFVTNALPFSQQFAFNLRDSGELCPNCDNTQAYQNFLNVLNKEKQTGGNLPIGQTPGGFGSTLDLSTLVPLAIGGVVLVMLMKNKKRK